MFKTNRCYDRPMNYNSESMYKYSNTNMSYTDYPQAVPAGTATPGIDGNMAMPSMMGCNMPPVYECPQERVCHKEFVHEVPHICPINTRVINHHIYRHTYTPCYTCCEENEVCNVYDGCCKQF